MRKSIVFNFLLITAIIFGLSGKVHAQNYGYMDEAQIEQIAAPIALYPDQLLGHIMSASLYPDQIAVASSWISTSLSSRHTDNSIVIALNRQPWHPSVKSLTAFPQVLSAMNGDPEWTAQISYLYSTQRDDLMDSIQSLRQNAMNAGVLFSSDYRTVYNKDGNIYISETSPAYVQSPVLLADYTISTPSGYAPYPLYVVRRVPVIRPVPFIAISAFWNNSGWGWHMHRPRQRHVVHRHIVRPQPRIQHRTVIYRPAPVAPVVSIPRHTIEHRSHHRASKVEINIPVYVDRSRHVSHHRTSDHNRRERIEHRIEHRRPSSVSVPSTPVSRPQHRQERATEARPIGKLIPIGYKDKDRHHRGDRERD